MCDLLLTAAAALPLDCELSPESRPCTDGFWWFERPIRLPCPEHDNEVEEIVAISWGDAHFGFPEHFPALRTPPPHGIGWTAFALSGGRAVGIPYIEEFLPNNVPVHEWCWQREVEERKLGNAARLIEVLNRVIVAGFLLVDDRIVTTSPYRLHRAARRRLEHKGLEHEPLVRVVELRRRAHEARAHAGHMDAEWACRWLVRGHWHRYHTKNGLQPRWVSPYVKGPDDKPLKRPRAEVFAVVR
jgi:hypothetical protein